MKRYIKSAITSLYDEDFDTLLEIAENENTSPDVLEEIYELRNTARHRYAIPYEAIAKNPNASESLLRKMYTSNKWYAEFIAKNPNISTELISELINNVIEHSYDDDELFISIGYNPNTTAKQLKQITDYVLTRNNAEHIMWSLLNNDKLPASALQKLVHSRKFAWMSGTLISKVYEHPNATQAIKSFLENNYRGYFI